MSVAVWGRAGIRLAALAIALSFLITTAVMPAEAVTKRSQKITWTGIIQTQVDGGAVKVSAKASSKLAVKISVQTPSICKVTSTSLSPKSLGLCKFTMSQAGNQTYKAASTIRASVAVIARTLVDRPDKFDGYQVHAIYVQPADRPDLRVDTNGYLTGVLKTGNGYLKQQINNTIPIDTFGLAPDIRYFKSSYTSEQLKSLQPNQLPALMQEAKPTDAPGLNRKSYVFFVDVPLLNGGYCGWADEPGFAVVVAMGGRATGSGYRCTGSGQGFNDFVVKTWIHEVFHNFGVGHSDYNCDIMYVGKNYCNTKVSIDASRNQYVTSANLGVNIMTLRVWQGYSANQTFRADCLTDTGDYPRTDPVDYIMCPLGTQPIGSLNCWSAVNSAEFQRFVDGEWQSLGFGYSYYRPWGNGVPFECKSPSYPLGTWFETTVQEPQTVRYRWIVNGQVTEPFDVVYLR